MKNTNENDNIVRLLGTATVKTTILQSKSEKTLEIENRVDPTLWYWKKEARLRYKLRYTICMLATIALSSLFAFVLLSSIGILIGIAGFMGLVVLFDVLPSYRELKEHEKLQIKEDYEKTYEYLLQKYGYYKNFQYYGPSIKKYFFLDDLSLYTLVDFFEKDDGLCFQYINCSGDYCEKTISITITRNINVQHSKIVMKENGWECIVPYKLQEKAPEQSGADD